MAMPAHLDKKYTGKRSCFAQVSFDQATPGSSWTDQELAQHCWHTWVQSELSSLAGKLLGGTEQLVPVPSTHQGRPSAKPHFPVQEKHITAAQTAAGEL